MYAKDNCFYNRLGFFPRYIDGSILVFVHRLDNNIIRYCLRNYSSYRFVYCSRGSIDELLYRYNYIEYQNSLSAYDFSATGFLCLLCVLLGLLCFSPPVFMIVMNVCYLFVSSFKLITTAVGWWFADGESNYSNCSSDLPVYTILIPIKNEKITTITSIIENIAGLDYPKDKLDVKLVVEEDCLKLVDGFDIPYEVIRVPNLAPQTKAKACNYALRFARGDYVVIYDADDKPHKLQLKKALVVFEGCEDVAVIQAQLNYYNYNFNHLTRCFALEYSNAFDFVLVAMSKLCLPVLLGGSSNHFRMSVLRELGAWDPYNVTEDADLGIKLCRAGYKLHVLRGYGTLEEAPLRFANWVKQRARWIKGYIVTYLVHMASPWRLLADVGLKSFVALQVFIVLPILIYIFAPMFWFAGLFINFGCGVYYFALANLILYLLVIVVTSVLSMLRRRMWCVLPSALLVPMYNMLHSFAAYRAVWQLIREPYKWDKTEHDEEK